MQQLSKFIKDRFDSIIWNREEVDETTTFNSNEVNSFSSHIHIQQRIGNTIS